MDFWRPISYKEVMEESPKPWEEPDFWPMARIRSPVPKPKSDQNMAFGQGITLQNPYLCPLEKPGNRV